ncbi:MAG: hypothetical protein IJF76_05525 [Clostridia bacterium]|nr:hypothetical protein [Clostridia bacterium]
MKKFSKVLVLVLVVLLALTFVFGCGGEQGYVKLVVMTDMESKTYLVNTEGTDMAHLGDLLEYLQETEGLLYTESGGFISSVNGYAPDSTKNEFWGIYTDLKIGDIPYFDNSWGTVEVENKVLGSATKGIAELPLSNGATYVLAISTY